MPPKKVETGETSDITNLRRIAEEKLSERRKKTGPLPASDVALRRLVHELEVHQIELEMQNEELIQAQTEQEAALKQYTELYDFAPIGYFTLARDGAIHNVNLTGTEILGVERSKLLEKRFGQFVAEKFRSEFIDFLERVFECGEQESFEVMLRKEDGEARWLQIEAICLADEQECRAAVVDITERKKAEELLKNSEAALKKAQQVSHVGSWAWYPSSNRLEWSDEMFRIFGVEQDEFSGDLSDIMQKAIHPDDRAAVEQSNLSVINDGKPVPLEYRIIQPDGTVRIVWAEAGELILDEAGNPAVLTGIVQDITERVQAEKDIKQSEELLKNAEKIAHLGYYQIDIQSGQATWSDELFRIFGVIPSQRGLSNEEYQKMVHPDDIDELNQHFDECVRLQKPFNMTYRIYNSIGEIRHIHGIGIIKTNTLDGKLIMFGTIQDVTEAKRAEDKIHQRITELEVLYESGLALSQLSVPKTIGETIINLLDQNMNWDHTTIRLYDPHSDTLKLLAFKQPELSSDEEQDEMEERYKSRISSIDDGLCGWAIRSSQIIRVGDVSTDPHYIETDPGIRSGIYLPLKTSQKMIGVISIESEKANHFSDNDEQFLATLANQAASALDNALLFHETHQRLNDLEMLNRISIAMRAVTKDEALLAIVLEETLTRLNTTHGSINLFNPATGKLHKTIARGWVSEFTDMPIRPGEGLFGKVFESGKVYISEDFSADPLTIPEMREQLPSGFGGICIPLHSPDNPLGILVVAIEGKFEISEDELRLLNTLAEMTGSALQRMQSDQRTMRHLEQLKTLHKIDQAITSSFDLKSTLSLLLSHTLSQLDVDAAEILLFNPHMLRLEYAFGQGFRTDVAKSTNLRMGEEFAGRVALERRNLSASKQDLGSQAPGLENLFIREGFVSYIGIPLISKGQLKGVMEIFHRTPLPAYPDWTEFLETLARQAAIAIDEVQLFENLQRSNTELTLAYDATIEGWSRAMDLRDKETEDHTKRVTELTLKMAELMGVGTEQIMHMRHGALLHDIGKLGVPDHVLLKPGKLTEDEWDLMRQHPQHSYDLLKPIEYLARALDIPYCHHEKWDGTGYPNGLKGEQIPIAARVFAVVDVWDALTSDRPYRPAWSEEKTLEYIKANSGTHFDPKIVDLFLLMIEENHELKA